MNFKIGTIEHVRITPLKTIKDERGHLTEMWRNDYEVEFGTPESGAPVMGYSSVTLPGVQRGPHQHRDQTDMFVFLGPGKMEVSLWDVRKNSPTFGNKMMFIANERDPFKRLDDSTLLTRVEIPPRVIHAYRNVDHHYSVVLNFPDRLYAGFRKQDPVDEVRWEGVLEEEFTDV